MRQIEGNRKPQHAIRVEELLRKPGVRQRNDVMRLQFAVQTLYAPRHECPFQLHGQVAQTRRQQSFITRIIEHDESVSARRRGLVTAELM